VTEVDQMSPLRNSRLLWPLLVVVAAIPRILGAFFLPNAFGDAYVYIRDIGTFSTKLATGTLHLTDLFGFWLPLYQLISAVLNVFVKNGFYSGKIVSAGFGVGVCLFIYLVTWRLTLNRRAAMLMFLVVAINPLHISYSASAMTDVPHAFFVLAALYFVLRGNWKVAAILGALAGFTRVESWMLIALIPLLQIIKERRISIVALVVLIVPPLFWFYVSWKATGDAFACFRQRQQYHDWLLMMNPAIARFSAKQIASDIATLLVSSDVAVLIACGVAGWFVVRQLAQIKHQRLSEETKRIIPAVAFFFAFFGLIFVAYLTHQQPIIFPRYGLLLFSLGLPILAWTYLWIRERRPQLARGILIGIIAICVSDASIQFVGAVGEINRYRAQRTVADYLRDHFDRNSDARVFCDEATVRVLSAIPEDKFVSSVDAPRDRAGFLSYLKEERVEYLVFVDNQTTTQNRLFHDLEDGDYRQWFERLLNSQTRFLPTQIWLYRFHAESVRFNSLGQSAKRVAPRVAIPFDPTARFSGRKMARILAVAG
jgi:dolichyl-phosphate-mannose-protein mannosyltransferase